MMKKREYGVFCEVYGKNLRNLIIEYLLVQGELDFAVGDMAEEVGISRPKAYEIMNRLVNQSMVNKTRTVAGTQLYCINYDNHIVKLLRQSFKKCLQMVANEYSEKENTKSRRPSHALTKPL